MKTLTNAQKERWKARQAHVRHIRSASRARGRIVIVDRGDGRQSIVHDGRVVAIGRLALMISPDEVWKNPELTR